MGGAKEMHGMARISLAALLAIGAAGCGRGEGTSGRAPAAARGTYTIVTTVGMVTDVARRVAGEKATVTGLIGEGVDPHLYKPTRSDVQALASADVVFYSGLLLEGKMADALVKIASRGKPVRAVTEGLPEEYLLSPPGLGGHHDPHVWMDASAWAGTADVIADTLAGFDPPSADLYRANAAECRREVEALHAWVQRAVATIPEASRVLVTAHDAFNYFGRAYGIEVKGIQGISTESEAGLADINRLVDLIVERGVRAVFVETSVADRNVRALIEGAAARGHEVRIGGRLFSDAMGPPGTYEGTYVGMIDHNATTIVRALGGEAPSLGMQGRLRE